MSSVPYRVAREEMTAAQRAEYESWCEALDEGRIDAGEAPELPDWEPERQDARWWAEELAHLEAQTPHVGPLSMPEHAAGVARARLELARAVVDRAFMERVVYGPME